VHQTDVLDSDVTDDEATTQPPQTITGIDVVSIIIMIMMMMMMMMMMLCTGSSDRHVGLGRD